MLYIIMFFLAQNMYWNRYINGDLALMRLDVGLYAPMHAHEDKREPGGSAWPRR